MRTPVSLQHPTAKVQRPAWLLLSIAVLSALIYWFRVTQPYHLFDLYQQPLLDLRRLTQGYPEELWPLIVEFVVLFALYLAAWQVVRRTHNRSAWLIVSGGAIVFFTRSMFYLTTFYLLLTVPWFHVWYAVWIIGLAALLPTGHAVHFVLLFSFAVLSEPLIFGPQILWPTRPPAESRLIEVYLGPLVLALSWLYAIYALFDTWRCRRSRLASE